MNMNYGNTQVGDSVIHLCSECNEDHVYIAKIVTMSEPKQVTALRDESYEGVCPVNALSFWERTELS